MDANCGGIVAAGANTTATNTERKANGDHNGVMVRCGSGWRGHLAFPNLETIALALVLAWA